MVRSVWSWIVAGAVLVAAPGCSSIGHVFSSDDDDAPPKEAKVSHSHSHVQARDADDEEEVAEAPVRRADPHQQEVVAMRAQIAQLKVEIAQAKAQQQQQQAPSMDSASAASSLARINTQLNDLEAQKADLDRKIVDLENQRRIVASSFGRTSGAGQYQNVSSSDPSDAALQQEEVRLRMQLQNYNQPGR